jgi:HEPN domain-containing protein
MVLPEAASLLQIAAADLQTAEATTDLAIFREGAWGFWLQQAVEKALKAWLIHLDATPPLSHDLRRLFRLVECSGGDPSPWVNLRRLTVYAVQIRYEADPETLNLDRRQQNLLVKELLDHVAGLVGGSMTG